MTVRPHPRFASIVGSAGLIASVTTIGTPFAHAAELTVCAQACEFTRIQDAVDFAHHGDLIKIGPGTYFENIRVNKSLTLSGAGRDKTRIDGQLAGPVITLDSPQAAADVPVAITNVTITHGRGLSVGGGVEVRGQARLDMEFCILISNRSDGGGNGAGGGINVESLTSAPNKITDTLVVYNHSQSGGGGIAVSFESVVGISRSTISRNDTASLGGGILLLSESIATIDNTSLTENRATLGGGGLAADIGELHVSPAATVTISDSVIADNSTSRDGGGMLGPAVSVSDTVIARNQAAIDGGGWLAARFPTLKNVFVVQNTAGHDGGGILTRGQLTLSATSPAQNHPNNCVEEPPQGSGCP